MPKSHERRILDLRILPGKENAKRYFNFFLNFLLILTVIVASTWGLRLYLPFSVFEATIVSMGFWGIVLLGAIYTKLYSIENAIADEEWDDEYDFYIDEDYEENLIPQEILDPPTKTTQGNVIHLEKRLFSKKEDQQ